MNALTALENFAATCGIPNKGGVKHGWGKLALADTPMLKFETQYYKQVRKALADTLEKDENFNIFFRGISLVDSLKNREPKGKYFTVCIEPRDPRRFSQMMIANGSSMGI